VDGYLSAGGRLAPERSWMSEDAGARLLVLEGPALSGELQAIRQEKRMIRDGEKARAG